MIRIIAVTMWCACMAACGSDNGSQDPDERINPQANNELNPTAIALDAPPSNGKLPVELLPPA